ncbi:uncharacterized protein AB675_8717 [Cyphellophora attinorum]|uniref:Uncharacterized protein n=1 Tax=Cyphellophora attinorum TaxID=1664694 RepID=A0A0N0NQS2_9EURO|nr:uncharacterized protein AB675_8717 [Phialophora attinorum]KPI44251.1 hypothetical protein AB675_8717 [Phialophora attinorum]
MVATRSSRKSSAANSPAPESPTTPSRNGHINGHVKGHANGKLVAATPNTKLAISKRKSPASGDATSTYAHVVDPLTILWLFVSLILVAWDTGYVFLRPWSMPGGHLHSPIWTPYALYGTVDYIYGWPAIENGVGFTAAQGALNFVESSMYGYYLFKLLQCGSGTEWYKVWDVAYWRRETVVEGEGMAKALVICFASAIMTLSKTVLYWLNEYFSNYSNIGHNTIGRLFFLWIIPNGLWLIVPTYMIYIQGAEIVDLMEAGSRKIHVKEE